MHWYFSNKNMYHNWKIKMADKKSLEDQSGKAVGRTRKNPVNKGHRSVPAEKSSSISSPFKIMKFQPLGIGSINSSEQTLDLNKVEHTDSFKTENKKTKSVKTRVKKGAGSSTVKKIS